MAQVNAISSINSQVSFSGNRKKPTIAGHGGGKTMAEKYGDTNISTANAKTILVDFIVDHAIELGVTGAALIGAFVKGKQAMQGASGKFVDAVKEAADNKKVLDVLKSVTKYPSTVVQNLKASKTIVTKADAEKALSAVEEKIAKLHEGVENFNIGDRATWTKMTEELTNEHKSAAAVLGEIENAELPKTVMSGSLVDKLTKKADDEKSIISKMVNSASAKKIILGEEKALEEGSKVTAEDLNKYLATKLGITRGSDIADAAIAATGAAGVANGANIVADAGTDVNDEQVGLTAKLQEFENTAGKMQELSELLDKLSA